MPVERDDDNERPVGREAVRAAILVAASRRFAAQGASASLRDIAADAGVNLGLIHRHFGNKDDLLRAVLARHAGAGVATVQGQPDLATAARRIFVETATGSPYLRIVASLLLGGAPVARYQDRFPTVDALRARAADDDVELRLLLGFAATYGWAVFGEQLLAAFGHRPDDHASLTERLAGLVAEVVGDERRRA